MAIADDFEISINGEVKYTINDDYHCIFAKWCRFLNIYAEQERLVNKMYIKEELKQADYIILAPGATAENIEINIVKEEELTKLIVTGDPKTELGCDDFDLTINKEIVISNKYDLDTLEAKIRNGVIYISIKSDSNVVTPVEIQ